MNNELREQHRQVRIANEAFYRAIEARDLDAMDGLWATSMQVLCVHTGREAAVGRPAVRAYWGEFFGRVRYVEFSIPDPAVTVIDRTGLVVCVERAAWSLGGEMRRSSVHATNLFYLEDDEWRLVHHHGSPPVFSGDGDCIEVGAAG